MKVFWTLYWKELKSNKIILLFLIIAAYGITYQSMTVRSYLLRPEEFLKSFSLIALFFIPLALYYLFKEERNNNRNYLIFSLPFRRDLFILSQFLVILSYIILIPIGVSILSTIMFSFNKTLIYNYTWSFKRMVIYTIHSGLDNLQVFVRHVIPQLKSITPLLILGGMMSLPVLLGGMMSLLVSLNSIIKRYRVAAGIIFLNSLILFFIVTRQIVIHTFRLYFGDSAIWYFGRYICPWDYVREFYLLEWLLMQWHMFALGLLFLLIGMHLYERYADI